MDQVVKAANSYGKNRSAFHLMCILARAQSSVELYSLGCNLRRIPLFHICGTQGLTFNAITMLPALLYLLTEFLYFKSP